MIPGELHSPKEKYYENRKLELRTSYKKGKENDPFEAWRHALRTDSYIIRVP